MGNEDPIKNKTHLKQLKTALRAQEKKRNPDRLSRSEYKHRVRVVMADQLWVQRKNFYKERHKLKTESLVITEKQEALNKWRAAWAKLA